MIDLSSIDVSAFPHWLSPGGEVLLINADCMAVLPLLPKVDAVVTDPPYGVDLGDTDGTGGKHGLKRLAYHGFEDTYENFTDNIVPRINQSIDIATRAAVFTGPHIHEQRKPDAIGGVYSPAAAGRHSWGFKNLLPVLFYGIAPDLNLGAKLPTVIQSSAQAEKSDHPCPKPESWMRWLVELTSRKGNCILDPFAGSFTTAVACIRTGRQCIAIEIDPKYYAIGKRRCEEAVAIGSLFDPVAMAAPNLFEETQ